MKLEDIVKLGMLIDELQETLHALIRDGVIELHSAELLSGEEYYYISDRERDYYCRITKDLYEYLKGREK